MSLIVRHIHEADIAAAAQLLHDSWHFAFAPYLPAGALDKMSLEACQEAWTRALSMPVDRLQCIGLFDGDTLLGTISSGLSRFRDESWFEIWSMHVTRTNQRQGAGSRLFAEAVKLCAEGGFQHMHLTCIAANTQAMNFYKKMKGHVQPDPINRRGFEEVEICWDLNSFPISS